MCESVVREMAALDAFLRDETEAEAEELSGDPGEEYGEESEEGEEEEEGEPGESSLRSQLPRTEESMAGAAREAEEAEEAGAVAHTDLIVRAVGSLDKQLAETPGGPDVQPLPVANPPRSMPRALPGGLPVATIHTRHAMCSHDRRVSKVSSSARPPPPRRRELQPHAAAL